MVYTPIALPGRRQSPKPSSTFLEALVDCLLRFGSSPPFVRGRRNLEVIGTLIGFQTDRCVHESKRRDRCRRRRDTSWMDLVANDPHASHSAPSDARIPTGPTPELACRTAIGYPEHRSSDLPLKTRNQAMDTKSRITSFGHRNLNRRDSVIAIVTR